MRFIGQLSKFLWYFNLVLVAVVLVVVFLSLDTGQPAADDVVRAQTAGEEVAKSDAMDEGFEDRVDPEFILQQDIFGTGQNAASENSRKAEVAQSVQIAPSAAKDLAVRLMGTIVDEAGGSYAILEDRTAKTQDIYRIGDVIGDVRLDSIEQNRVVVLSDDVRHVLDLDLSPGVPRAPQTRAIARQATPPQPVVVNNGEIVRVVSGSERQINTRASSAAMSKAGQLLSRMKLSPNVTDGKADGLRISGLGDSALAQLVGLRDGDVIQTINGHPVSNQKKAAQVLRKARLLGTAEVQFARGREERSLAFRAGTW